MDGQDYNSGQFITVDEAINSLLSRERDIAGVNKLHYKELSKDVFNAMNLSAIKQTKRFLYTIDPRTHRIDLPQETFAFSTISVITDRGKIEPLVFNTDITDDLVELGLDKNCESECGCTDVICNYTKHYETITEDVEALMPDDTMQTFTKTIKKFINKDGSTYMEVTQPEAQYVDQTHTSTILVTTKTFLCKLQTKPCGCVINNEFNRDVWAKNGSSLAIRGNEDIMTEWGCPTGYFPKSTTYNIVNNGTQIKFPSNFPYKKVLVRVYVTNSTKNLLIPYLCKEAFLSGIKKISVEYNPKESQYIKAFWKNKWNAEMTLLRLILNRLMLNEYYEYWFGMNTTPGMYYQNNRFDDAFHYPY